MSIDMTKLVRLNALDSLASVTSSAINEVKTTVADAIKNVAVNGNTVNFYTESEVDSSTTVAFTFDFPAEMVIDQAHTTFEPNFAFDSDTYVDATDPNLDGKPVLVLGVKTTDAQNNITIAYSFLNLYNLVDLYSVKSGDSSKLLVINGKEIEVKISATAGNIITANADGFYATTRVAGASAGNIAIFDANGAPSDGGISSDTLVTTSMIASDADVNSVLGSYFSIGGSSAGE